MTFIWSEALWLLLAVPVLLALYLAWLRGRKRAALRYPAIDLARAAITPAQRIRGHVPPVLVLLAVLALIVAMARPAAVLERPAREGAVVLAIDVSLSMAATDVQPTRLAAAQSAARTFINAQPRGVRVAIVAFAGDANVVQAPTRDRAALLAAVDRLQLQYHTAIGNAIMASLLTLYPDAEIARGHEIFGLNNRPGAPPSRHPGAGAPRSHPTLPLAPGTNTAAAVVLLTDGENTIGIRPRTAAEQAAKFGVRIYTVGFGKTQGGRVETDDGWSMHVGFDERALKEIADITTGTYFHASTGGELERIYRGLSGRLMVERRETEISAAFTGLAAALTLASALLSLGWSGRIA